ncbi:MAG: AraC family transcriptional regulator, partial [Gammaproteobacteria bacterium]|nr:AraC family transcriptional regulator [Gammaproteobacteria bacterium]
MRHERKERVRVPQRPPNRFDATLPGESKWHTHAGGQFILVETGVSHLATEAGAWIVPTRRIGWVPPGVRHMSRPSRIGKGWVIIAPAKFAGDFPK